MQIRYMHKFSIRKPIFVKIGKFAQRFERFRLKQVFLNFKQQSNAGKFSHTQIGRMLWPRKMSRKDFHCARLRSEKFSRKLTLSSTLDQIRRVPTPQTHKTHSKTLEVALTRLYFSKFPGEQAAGPLEVLADSCPPLKNF